MQVRIKKIQINLGGIPNDKKINKFNSMKRPF